jgi:RimJ/RimL family protein N-acetyltransferase
MIETPRLILRPWRDADRDPFARMNADPRVMEFFPACLSREESDALFDRARLSVLAAELRDTGEFIGFIGLSVPTFEAHFTPCVEIGWRLAAEHWGRGLATEGARAVLATAAGPIVSFTSVQNARSRRVMEKIGLTHDPADDFDHPRLSAGHPLRRHVLYRSAKLR